MSDLFYRNNPPCVIYNLTIRHPLETDSTNTYGWRKMNECKNGNQPVLKYQKILDYSWCPRHVRVHGAIPTTDTGPITSRLRRFYSLHPFISQTNGSLIVLMPLAISFTDTRVWTISSFYFFVFWRPFNSDNVVFQWKCVDEIIIRLWELWMDSVFLNDNLWVT